MEVTQHSGNTINKWRLLNIRKQRHHHQSSEGHSTKEDSGNTVNQVEVTQHLIEVVQEPNGHKEVHVNIALKVRGLYTPYRQSHNERNRTTLAPTLQSCFVGAKHQHPLRQQHYKSDDGFPHRKLLQKERE